MAEQEHAADKPNYGNWDSWKLLSAFASAAVVFFSLSLLFIYFLIGAPVFLAIFGFAYGRYTLSPRGGNQMSKLWDQLLQHLEWDGNGRAIDSISVICFNTNLAFVFRFSQPRNLSFYRERIYKSFIEPDKFGQSTEFEFVLGVPNSFKSSGDRTGWCYL